MAKDMIAREEEGHHHQSEGYRDVWKRSAQRVEQTTDATRTEDAIAVATCAAADLLQVPVIVCLTSSGFTARTVASYRPSVPILGVTPEVETFRRLSLNWGVIPAIVERRPDYASMLDVAKEVIVKKGLAWPGDRFVVTAGVPFDVAGTTNLLKIEEV
jgi:pyruvate kinase